MNSELIHIPETTTHRPILLLSDFDMTLASTYAFSPTWQTHVPILDRELVSMLTKPDQLLCIATARGAREPVSWMIGHRFLNPNIPLVVENGAALLWNRNALTTQPVIELLISDAENTVITRLQNGVQSVIHSIPEVSNDHCVLVRPNRVASIELRAEHKDTHQGTPHEYVHIAAFLLQQFPEIGSLCTVSMTGSSLTIEPKSVNKKTGLLAAMKRADIDTSSVFPIGLGDNKNDTPIFTLARELGGIAIGVSPDVDTSECDLTFLGGEKATKQIVQHIQTHTL